jgi:hypothetical protein
MDLTGLTLGSRGLNRGGVDVQERGNSACLILESVLVQDEASHSRVRLERSVDNGTMWTKTRHVWRSDRLVTFQSRVGSVRVDECESVLFARSKSVADVPIDWVWEDSNWLVSFFCSAEAASEELSE